MFESSGFLFPQADGDLRGSRGRTTVLNTMSVVSLNLRINWPRWNVHFSSKSRVAAVCISRFASACHSAARLSGSMRAVLYGSSRRPSKTGMAHYTWVDKQGVKAISIVSPVICPRSPRVSISSAHVVLEVSYGVGTKCRHQPEPGSGVSNVLIFIRYKLVALIKHIHK